MLFICYVLVFCSCFFALSFFFCLLCVFWLLLSFFCKFCYQTPSVTPKRTLYKLIYLGSPPGFHPYSLLCSVHAIACMRFCYVFLQMGGCLIMSLFFPSLA